MDRERNTENARRIVVRSPRHGEGHALGVLYRDAFAERLPGRNLWPRFGFDETLVAALGDRIVGVGCFEPAGDDLDPLLASLEPGTRRFLEPIGRAPEAAVVIEAPIGSAPVRLPGDWVFTALAVDPAFRRRGIGRKLALARLELAARVGAPQVFVHAVTGAGSRELYEGLGFVPLVRVAHHYADGTGMTLLYRRILPPAS